MGVVNAPTQPPVGRPGSTLVSSVLLWKCDRDTVMGTGDKGRLGETCGGGWGAFEGGPRTPHWPLPLSLTGSVSLAPQQTTTAFLPQTRDAHERRLEWMVDGLAGNRHRFSSHANNPNSESIF
uniref:Uncharacterized protein n=1 Tax=Knipowitschia caucasica TaxID=637954 RepID=A0AAV2JVP0_KNICA